MRRIINFTPVKISPGWQWMWSSREKNPQKHAAWLLVRQNTEKLLNGGGTEVGTGVREKTLRNTQMFVIWNGLLWLSLVASVVEQLNWFSTDRRADKNKYTSANNLFIREIAVYLETPSDCNLPAEQQLKKMPSNKSHHTSINCGMAGQKMYDARTSSPSGWMSSIIPHYRGNVMLTIIIN